MTSTTLTQKYLDTSVADSGGVRHPPLAYITTRVHQMIMQEWHAATTNMYQFLTDLQTFD